MFTTCVLPEIDEFVTRLPSPDLLDACQRGLIQNPNESINNMIWSKYPKSLM